MRIFEHSSKDQKAYILKLLIDAYIQLEPVGGSLHVILGDGNYGIDCTDYAEKNNDEMGKLIMELLNEFTEDERRLIIEEGSWRIRGTLEFGHSLDWSE
jgi:hypothetical protein